MINICQTFFSKPEKYFVFLELRNFLRYSFDVEIRGASISGVFRVIQVLLPLDFGIWLNFYILLSPVTILWKMLIPHVPFRWVVKECRNQAENIINGKRVNFCIKAILQNFSQFRKIIFWVIFLADQKILFLFFGFW